MRTVYPALYYQREKALEVAGNVARMTHWHKDSTDTVLVYTEAVNAIANSDWSPEEAKVQAEAIMEDFMFGIVREEPEPSGYSVASLVCAMNAIRDTNSFEDALVYAVNRGGDADTIGAITGGTCLGDLRSKRNTTPLVEQIGQRAEQTDGAAVLQRRNPSGNALLIRLVELAHQAYKHR